MDRETKEFFEADVKNVVVDEEEEGVFKKIWNTVKKNPLVVGTALVGVLVGGVAVHNKDKQEMARLNKVNDLAVDEAYSKGRIDGTIDTYDKIMFTFTKTDER